MSGRRQHYIPQFLLKGFLSHSSRKNGFTWIFRKGKEPFNSNIINIAVENYFYSKDKESDLDNMITEYENEVSRSIAKLETNTMLNNDEIERIATLIAHFEIRTNHLRKSFLESHQHLMNVFVRYIDDTECFAEFCIEKVKNDPKIIADAVLKEMLNYKLPESLFPFLKELTMKHFDINAREFYKNMIPLMAETIKTKLPDVLKESVKNGHIKLLSGTLSPEVKVQRYKELNYKLYFSDSTSIPLGDSIVIFHTDNIERPYKPFLESDDIIKAVILPISTKCVLIGSIEEYKPDFELLKIELIKSSIDFFILNSEIDNYMEFTNLIGMNSYLLKKEQAEEIMQNIMLG